MKKKRKFKTGGEFELDADALAAGLRMGRNENIRPEDREAGIAAVERAVNASKGISDTQANMLMKSNVLPADMQTPAGQAEPRRAAPTPRAAAPRRDISNDYSMGEMRGSGRGSPNSRNPDNRTTFPEEGVDREPTPERRFPQRTDFMGDPASIPSRGSYDRPGPIGGAIDAIKDLMSKTPRARAAAKRKLLRERPLEATPMKKGGAVKAKRGDGIAQRGKTKGRFV